jgi:hypothetical protein
VIDGPNRALMRSANGSERGPRQARTGERLDVDAPLGRVQVEGRQRALLAEGLHLDGMSQQKAAVRMGEGGGMRQCRTKGRGPP